MLSYAAEWLYDLQRVYLRVILAQKSGFNQRYSRLRKQKPDGTDRTDRTVAAGGVCFWAVKIDDLTRPRNDERSADTLHVNAHAHMRARTHARTHMHTHKHTQKRTCKRTRTN